MKRKRISSKNEESTGSNSRSIKHYFNNAITTEKTSAIVDPFERNLDRAIKQSLLETNSNLGDPTDISNTQITTVNSTTYMADQHQSNDFLNQCPICGVLLDQEVDPNRHINSCLDDFERHDSPKKQKESITPHAVTTLATNTQNKAESSSSTALQLLPNRATKGGYESSNDKRTSSNTGQKKTSSPSKKTKRKCPFYKWIQGKRYIYIYIMLEMILLGERVLCSHRSY